VNVIMDGLDGIVVHLFVAQYANTENAMIQIPVIADLAG